MMLDEDQAGWEGFLRWCLAAQTQAQLDELFALLLTIEERRALALRYLIVSELIKEQKTQRQIAADLKVSISKITRGSNSLKIISTRLRQFLNQLIK